MNSSIETQGLSKVGVRARKEEGHTGGVASTGGRESNGGVGKRLLNVKEAARYLGIEVDTVYKKARLRELPSVKVGRALRFDLNALERKGCTKSAGGKEVAIAVPLSTARASWPRRWNGRRCRRATRTVIWMSNGRSTFG